MKTNVFKRAGLVVACMGLCMIALASTAGAASIGGSSSGMRFNRSWERYASGDGGRAGLFYGFNTFGVNEVYAHANHNGRSHYAQIRMSGRIYNGKTKRAGSRSSVQYRHTSNSVSYYCIW